MQPNKGDRPLIAGITLAILTSLVIVWTTIVRDDGSGAASFMIIMAAGAGAYAASFRPEGLVRAMRGVAVMQVTLGLLTATAPMVAAIPGESVRALAFSGAFTLAWLAAAALFGMAAKARARAAG